MRIAAIVGVKDEAGLIASCIERLFAIGVDTVIVVDDSSTDGTAEIVNDLVVRLSPRLRVVSAGNDWKSNLDRAGPILHPLMTDDAPEWVFFTDADEFWLPETGDLNDVVASATEDVLVIDRFNVPLVDPPFRPSGGGNADQFLDAPLIVERQRIAPESLDVSSSVRLTMHAIGPKVLCRAARLGSIALGGHDVTSSDGGPLVKGPRSDVVIVHVPFDSYSRFERKIDNTRRFFARYDGEYTTGMAWQWRHWLAAANRGLLDREFERERISSEELDEMRRRGVVSTARALFADRARANVKPGETPLLGYSPTVVRDMLFRDRPELYALVPIKQRLFRVLGAEGAARAFAQLTGRGADFRTETLPVTSLQTYAREMGRGYRELLPASEVRVPKPPVFGGTEIDELHAFTRTFFVAVLTDVTIPSKSNFLLAGGRALLDFQADEMHIPVDHMVDSAVVATDRKTVTVLTGREPSITLPRAFSLVGGHSYNFGHWILEFLPKLWAYLDTPGFEKVPILVDAQMPAQHIEALELFARGHPIVRLAPGQCARVDELWICSMLGYLPLGWTPESNSIVRVVYEGRGFADLITKALPSIPRLDMRYIPTRIFLTRKDSQHRRLVNRAEVENWFTSHGFTVVDFEELSFIDQLRYVRGADVVVGPDGSSMLMAVFARTSARVGILTNPFPEDYVQLFSARGQVFSMLTGELVEEEPVYKKFSAYRIELAHLEEFFHHLLTRAAPAVKSEDHEVARATESVKLKNSAVLVVGMHRSGTSMACGILSRLGVDFGANLMPATMANPKGFYEHLDVFGVHESLLNAIGSSWEDPPPWPDPDFEGIAHLVDRLTEIVVRDFAESTVWGVKDPRLCRFMPLWFSLLDELDVEVTVLLTVRSPVEVAGSLYARDGIPPDLASLLWLAHMVEAEWRSRGLRRAAISYSEMLSDWPRAFAKAHLPAEVRVDGAEADATRSIAAFVDAKLRHHQADRAVDVEDPELSRLCSRVFEELLAWSDGREPNPEVFDAARQYLSHPNVAAQPYIAYKNRRAALIAAEVAEPHTDSERILRAELENVARSRDIAVYERDELRGRLEASDRTLGDVMNSRSWALTAPLRRAVERARDFRERHGRLTKG